MSKTNVGEIEYVVSVNTDELKSGLNKADDEAKSGADKLGGAFAKIGAMAAKGVAVASTALAGLGVAAVKNYADYEQLTGGIETLFKNSSDTMMDYAQDAYMTAGLSANQYMELATSFSASLLQGLGGDTAKAAEYADMAITDMSDNANKMGTSMESLQFAYQGFAKQNYTMLDNLKLGYGGTKEEMQRLLKDAEKMPEAMGKKFDLNNYSDVVQAINVVQKNMGIAGTTAKEAGSTISGSFGAAKAAWSNLITAMAGGKELGSAGGYIDDFVRSVKTFAGNVMPVAKQALSGIVQLVAELAPMIVEQIPPLLQQILSPLIKAGTDLITQLIAMLPTLIPIIVDGAVQLFMGLVNALPVILPALLQGIIALIQGIAQLFTNPEMLDQMLNAFVQCLMMIVEALPKIIEALMVALPKIITAITGWLLKPETLEQLLQAGGLLIIALFQGLIQLIIQGWNSALSTLGTVIGQVGKLVGDVFGGAWKEVEKWWGGIGAWFTGVWKNVENALAGVAKWFGDLFSGAWRNVQNAFSAVGGFFRGIWNTITGIFSSIGTAIGSAIGGAFKNVVNTIIGFAEGTINTFIRGINAAIGLINAIPGVNIGKVNELRIPRMETGGIVPNTAGGRLILAGEGGQDEWVVPESKMASMIEKLGGNDKRQIVVNISGVFATDQSEQRKVALAIAEQLELIERQRLN